MNLINKNNSMIIIIYIYIYLLVTFIPMEIIFEEYMHNKTSYISSIYKYFMNIIPITLSTNVYYIYGYIIL